MSQRYYFHLINCTHEITDRIGAVAIDVEQAHAEAISVITEMKDAGELPTDLSDWNLEIRTESGDLVCLIRLG